MDKYHYVLMRRTLVGLRRASRGNLCIYATSHAVG